MKLKIEILFQGECLETRSYDNGNMPYHLPLSGEKIRIDFQNNDHTTKYGSFWKIEERCFVFSSDSQTIQFRCVPLEQDASVILGFI